MRSYVIALRTLYKRGSKAVTKDFLDKQLADSKITQEEYDYIIADETTE
jgi:hypothetical protein